MAAERPPAELIVVGRLGAPHGVAGWIRVASYTQPPDNIAGYRPWLVGTGGAQRPFEVSACEARGRGLFARLVGVDNREQARALSGCDILVPRSVLPDPEDPDEFYWRDLVGLEVVNDDGRRLGRVRSLIATGPHDVLVIDGPGGECLIPFLAVFVRAVKPDDGRIEVSWQEPV